MAYYWPQYGIAIEVDDDPHLAFRRRGIPRYDGLPRYHRCDLRPRVVLGARPPHRAYPRHRAPTSTSLLTRAA